MLFLTGPRQVGKTTLAKSLLTDPIDGVNYFNWDILEHRKLLTTKVFSGDFSLKGDTQKIIVFDEIHKYPRWKNALKGLFDKNEPDTHWIITGSAMLNVYRKGQDSLVGRSFSYNLGTLSVAELVDSENETQRTFDSLLAAVFSVPSVQEQSILADLFKFSGFPEPYLQRDESFLSKWRSSRLERLVNQDLAATENLRHLPLVENLMFLLPSKIGSPLSLNSLREDIEVHFATVKHWMALLERIYYGFSVYPYSSKVGRMLRKEAKWYLLDWTELADKGRRFENMVAVHLMKYVNFINDTGQGELSLHYVRDKEKHEVDFLICNKRKPEMLIECKYKDTEPHPHLSYFAKKLKAKRAIQVVFDPVNPSVFDKADCKIEIVSAASFLKKLI